MMMELSQEEGREEGFMGSKNSDRKAGIRK